MRALLLFVTLLVPLCGQPPSSDVSMGIFPFLVGNMDSRVQEVVDRCEQNDIDTIYVSVFRATGPSRGELWVTDAAGGWNSAWGRVRPTGAGIDLRALIAAATAKGMRVVGVIKCFDDSVQPTDASHRAYLLDVLRYLTDSYQPNGEPTYDMDIALDYVRFVGRSGNSPQVVTDFVGDVKALIGTRQLHAYLIANRFTLDGPTYDGRFNSYTAVIQTLSRDYGQNWEQLAQHVDVMMPMCYTADGSIYRSYTLHQSYVRQAAAYCRTACNRASQPGRRVTPAIKTYTSSGETTTDQTVEASITGALLGGAEGYQAFRYGTMQNSWWGRMKAFAVAGPNFPMPAFTLAARGLTGTVDASASSDRDEPSAALQVRIDWNGDGRFDTGWLPNVPADALLPRAGSVGVGLGVRDSEGHISTTTRRFSVPDVLQLSVGFVSATQGGTISASVDVGPRAAGATYMMLATFSGTSPGTAWRPGYDVPLNLDAFSVALLTAANTPLFQNAIGSLDGSGQGRATLVVPPGVLGSQLLSIMSWAAIAVDAQGDPLFVTNADGVLILP